MALPAREAAGKVDATDLRSAWTAIKMARPYGRDWETKTTPVHVGWDPDGLSLAVHTAEFYVAARAAAPDSDRPVLSATISVRDVVEALRTLRDGLVAVTVTVGPNVDEGSVAFADATTTVRCPVLTVDKAKVPRPPRPIPRGADVQVFDADAVRLVRQVATAASDDLLRPVLTRIHFEDREIAATDSYRLHIGVTEGDPFPTFDIPAAALRWVPTAGDWAITMNDDGLWWSSGLVAVHVPRLEGNFPKFRSLYEPIRKQIALGQMGPVRFDRQTLLAAAKQAAALTTKTARSADEAAKLAVKAGVCTVSRTLHTSKPTIEFSTDVACVGPAMTIWLNPGFLVSLLEAFATDTVDAYWMGDPIRPLWWQSEDDVSFGTLIMPIRSS